MMPGVVACGIEAVLASTKGTAEQDYKIRTQFRRLHTREEQLWVLDLLGASIPPGIYSDDLDTCYSSAWSARQGAAAISNGGDHLGIVYEAGPGEKATVTIDGISIYWKGVSWAELRISRQRG